VPDPWLKRSTALAFLGPAWSISLEWQFYLIAPLAYWAAVSRRPMHRIGICVFCAYLFWGRNYLPQDVYVGYATHGAFLPFHVEYFFIGALSYFIFKKMHSAWADVFFPVSACAALFLWRSTGDRFVPICFWILFMGLLCENPASYSARIFSPLFNHPIIQFLGRISYSIYLSHTLIMTAAQYALLRFLPSLSQDVYFWALLVATTVGTVLASAWLYRYVEAPGIRLGRELASRLRATPGGFALAKSQKGDMPS
jgi:peptidoglycan/LPS O-acetylase OafA/YrhL